MPSLEEHKNDVVKRILEVNNKATLQEIEAILKRDSEVVAVTASGKKLSETGYIDYLNKISESIKNGEKTYTSEEVKAFVLNRG